MDLLQRRRAMMARPYDAVVEYLQGDNEAYINTGIIATGDVSIKTRLYDYFSGSYKGKWAFGGRVAYHNRVFGLYINSSSNYLLFSYGSADVNCGLASGYSEPLYDIEIHNGTIKIGERIFSYTPSIFDSNQPLILFGLNNNGTILSSSVKIGATFISDGTMTLDLIPVRVGQVGYMYDKVSGRLFGNAGTGDFVLGPDI